MPLLTLAACAPTEFQQVTITGSLTAAPDGDGGLCVPGVTDEVAGLVELEPVGAQPGFTHALDLTLAVPCGDPAGITPVGPPPTLCLPPRRPP